MDELVTLPLLLAVSFVPPIALALRLRNAERRRREPWRLLLAAFAWGAFAAATLAYVFERVLAGWIGERELLIAALPVTISLPIVTVFAAPIVEEIVKLAGLLRIREKDPEPEDGYIYGGAVGLGFAATENVIYVTFAWALAGREVAVATALYRGIATVALHGAASAIAGYGLWRARYGGRPLTGLFAIFLAILLHVAYNALAEPQVALSTLGAAALAVIAYMRMMRRVRVLDARGR